MEPATSPIVIFLALSAGVAVFAAWVLAFRAQRRRRELVVWVVAHHGPRWDALPELTRRLNLAGAIEHLRREGLGDDPEFMDRYRIIKRSRRWQVILQLAGMALIGAIILGVRYWGWAW